MNKIGRRKDNGGKKEGKKKESIRTWKKMGCERRDGM